MSKQEAEFSRARPSPDWEPAEFFCRQPDSSYSQLALSQLLSSAAGVRKQPWMICKWMGVAWMHFLCRPWKFGLHITFTCHTIFFFGFLKTDFKPPFALGHWGSDPGTVVFWLLLCTGLGPWKRPGSPCLWFWMGPVHTGVGALTPAICLVCCGPWPPLPCLWGWPSVQRGYFVNRQCPPSPRGSGFCLPL